MAATAEQLAPHHEQLNREHRLRTDTATWLAETLHGSMRTAFEFRLGIDDLYGEDRGSVGEIFDDAIQAAHLIVEENPGLIFELRRRLIEAREYENMLAMARGELWNDKTDEPVNTIVVVSDFPPELMEVAEDVGGYNTSRRQTMLRVISREPAGTIRLVTQSLDGSNRQALEAIYACFGIRPEPGELLDQRISTTLEPWQQNALPDNLRNIYDQSLVRQAGGAWHAGIRQTGAAQIDTYQFARDQRDLIEWFIEAKLRNPGKAEKLRFKIAATATERYEKACQRGGLYTVPESVAIGRMAVHGFTAELVSAQHRLEQEIERASSRAATLGMTFSGCGASVSAEVNTEGQLRESGYGNQTSDRFGSLTFKCRKGHTNTRPYGKKIPHCKTCGDSVDC